MVTKQQASESAKTRKDVVFGKDLKFAAAEAYRLLRANLLFSLQNTSEHKCQVVGVTSSIPGEGKSTTALNLAYMLAEANKRVILIEGDMRLPTISKRLGLNQSPGLSNLLAGLSTGQRVVQPSGIEDRLNMISSGDIPPNPSELLGFSSLKSVIEVLSQNADFIIFDLPPVCEVADALVVSHLLDGMIMVVRQNYSNRREVSNAMRMLENANVKVLGFVLNVVGNSSRQYKKYSKNYYKNYGRYGHRYYYYGSRSSDKSTDENGK